MKPRRTHVPQALMDNGTWLPLGGIIGSRAECCAYVFGIRDGWPPFRAHRVLRSDGKITDEWPAHSEVNVGMIAGFPTAAQYEAAAQQALDRAAKIRKMEAEREARRRS